AVVVGEGLRELQKHPFGTGVGDIRVAGNGELRYPADRSDRVVDIELPVGCVIRVEGESKETSFPTRRHGQSQERSRVHDAALDHLDVGSLFDDEQTVVALWGGDEDWLGKARSDLLESQRRWWIRERDPE